MRIDELKDKISSENHIIGSLQIACGEKIETPNVLGVFEEGGVWYVYDTNDRGGIVILDSGSEDEMTDALYRRVIKAENRYLKKLKK